MGEALGFATLGAAKHPRHRLRREEFGFLPWGIFPSMKVTDIKTRLLNFFILETIGSEAEAELAAEILDKPPKRCGGELLLPEGPGIGVELNEAAMDRRPYEVREGWR